MPRTARKCTICGSTVVKLSNHLAQVHKLSKDERAELLQAAKKMQPDPRATGQPKQKRRKKLCPIEGCDVATDRLHDHLTGKHGLTGEVWKSARLEVLKMARESDETMECEKQELLSMVPYKAESSIDTISIGYLRPDCEQDRIESMLPLPTWCHDNELQTQLLLQEKINGEDIFGTDEITVDLTAIFRKNRKRRRR